MFKQSIIEVFWHFTVAGNTISYVQNAAGIKNFWSQKMVWFFGFSNQTLFSFRVEQQYLSSWQSVYATQKIA